MSEMRYGSGCRIVVHVYRSGMAVDGYSECCSHTLGSMLIVLLLRVLHRLLLQLRCWLLVVLLMYALVLNCYLIIDV